MLRSPLQLAVLALILGILAVGLIPPSFAKDDSPQPGETLAPNDAKESLRKEFSLAAALKFSQTVADQWAQKRNCVTCHTNGLHLITAAHLAPQSAGNQRTRDFAKEYLHRYVIDQQPPSRQHGSVEGKVATAAFLTISDILTEGNLSETTRASLDHIWTLQDEDGAWSQWLKCGWPPFESDDHFGVSLVTVALSYLPESERKSARTLQGIAKLKRWLQKNPPENLHHKGMLLWAESRWRGWVSKAQKRSWQRELLTKQRTDGGWRLVDLGASRWKRSTDEVADLPSDAYATAFSVFFLRNSGVSAKHPVIKKGLNWLRRQQRESGRWFTRSPKRDGHHFISHAATHFALLAFDLCRDPASR